MWAFVLVININRVEEDWNALHIGPKTRKEAPWRPLLQTVATVGLLLRVVVCWNYELLTNLNLVGIFKLIAVRVEYPHIFIRVSIELFTDP